MATMSATHRATKLAIHLGVGAPAKVDTMLARQNLTGLESERRDISAGSIGCLGDVALPMQGNVCFFTGMPINGPDVGQLIDANAATRLFPCWDGAFSGVYWDAERQVLVVATDCLGIQPLYMRHTEDELTLVSETKAVPGDPDLAAWGAFISIGHPIGERTLVDGLRRVPPASILTYDCATRRLSIRSYWQWPEPSDAWRHYDFLDSLEQDVRAYAACGDPGTLLLSGGFDSRLLMFLLQRAQIPADALIVAHADEYGDADGRQAEAVAKLSGMRYRKAEPPSEFFSSAAYLDYLNASDVGYPSLNLFIAKVASQVDSRAVWDGLIPGFVFIPAHQPEGGFESYVQQEIQGSDSPIWQAARQLFRPEVVEAMLDGFSEDWQSEIARLPQDAYGLLRFVIQNRCRNRAAMNPLKVYTNQALAFTPGVSKDFLTHVASIPFREKQHGRFYRNLFERLDKRALAVPLLSGGQLMKGARAGPTYLREALRVDYLRFRARHPSLLSTGAPFHPQSTFLDQRLLEADESWLKPDAFEQLRSGAMDDYPVWKLLFHWQAWRWVHEGRLESMLGSP